MIQAFAKVLGLACFLFLSAGVRAEEKHDLYMVVIGVNKYPDEQIKPRKFAEADAAALYDLFVSKGHFGAKAENVKLLLGQPDAKRPSEPATRANILKALNWLETKPTKDDLVVFAFLGAGSAIGERPCYFAVDSTFKDRAKNAIASGDIEHVFDNLKSQKSIALVDANFLGVNLPKGETVPEPALNLREFLGNEEAKGTNPSRVVMLPNDGLKPSLNLDKHGVFTQILLDALSGKADIEGYEADGNITIAELVKYVRKELPNLAREKGTTDDEKAQFPAVLDFHSVDYVVDHNPAAYPKAQERVKKFEAIAKDKDLPKDIAEEGAILLNRMPKLEAKQKLRKAYQKLADGTIDTAALTTERQAILDSTKIAEKDANAFAMTVLRAAKMVKQNYFQDANVATLVENAVNGMYKGLNEEMTSSIKEKLKNAKNLKEIDQVKLLSEMRQHLGLREDLSSGKDVTAALNAMMLKLDRHTGYIDPETLQSMQRDIQGHFSGIGVQIRRNFSKDVLQVVTPIIHSPAYKAGLLANDLITTIIREFDSEGTKLKEKEVIPTKGMTTDQAVKKILGKEGTKVKLLIEREGEKKPLEFELIRGRVEVESVMGFKRQSDDSWNYVIDPENKICYVRLTQFSYNTGRDLEAVMRKLTKEAGIKGFILDLRFNPGGLLDQAVRISDLFMDDGLIVTIRPRNGPETSYVGKSDGSYATFPMVCLVNGGSASASEIVSACLQDHVRCIVVGSRSYGKGSVQTIHAFETGGRLKLTTATFWRPSDKNLNKASTSGKDEDVWGVSPDIEVKLSKKEENDLQDFQRDQEIIRGAAARNAEAKPDFKDRQLDAAVEYLRSMIKSGTRVGAKKTTKSPS